MSNLSVTPRERTIAMGTGAVLGMAGMSAYYLPITKDRFIKTAFNIVKNETEDKIEILNETALAKSRNNLKPEHKLFLSQLGIAEDVDVINNKIADLKYSITDNTVVKNLKQGFADSFADCKKSEVFRDALSSKAFNKIHWTNFGWGAVIGFVLGNVLGMHIKTSDSKNSLL